MVGIVWRSGGRSTTNFGAAATPRSGRAGLEFAFDELDADEVVSFTETRNDRSRAVMERLGFHYRKDIAIDDEPFALYIFAQPDI